MSKASRDKKKSSSKSNIEEKVVTSQEQNQEHNIKKESLGPNTKR